MVAAVVFAFAVLMFCVERLRAAREWPIVPTWWARVIALNGFQVAIVFVVGKLWDPFLDTHRLWNGSELGLNAQVLVGYLAITFIYYWWHRWRHEVPLLWRFVHQVHHSPQRLEIVTSFYKHPLEIALNGLLSSAILFTLVGVSPLAASISVGITGVAELVYHWNVKTPYWLGFIFQRPESHCVHHEQGSHTHNFSDLPLWDILFGTFHNPRKFDGRCGFAEDAELQLGALLLGRETRA